MVARARLWTDQCTWPFTWTTATCTAIQICQVPPILVPVNGTTPHRPGPFHRDAAIISISSDSVGLHSDSSRYFIRCFFVYYYLLCVAEMETGQGPPGQNWTWVTGHSVSRVSTGDPISSEQLEKQICFYKCNFDRLKFLKFFDDCYDFINF